MAYVSAVLLNQTDSGATDTTFTSANGTHVADDLLVHIIGNDTGTTAITASAGWTELLTQTTTTGSRAAIFYKIAASSSEADPVFTGTGDGWAVTSMVIRDADTSTPFDASAQSIIGAGTTVTYPTVTTTTANTLVIRAAAGWDVTGMYAFAPSNLRHHGVAYEAIISMAMSGIVPAIGAVGTLDVEFSRSDGGAAYTLAIRNKSGGGFPPVVASGLTFLQILGQYGSTVGYPTFTSLDSSIATLAGITVEAASSTVALSNAINLTFQNNQTRWNWTVAGPSIQGITFPLSVNLTGKTLFANLGVSQISQTGSLGALIILFDGSSNWSAFRVPKTSIPAALSAVPIFVDSSSTPIDSSGTLNWAAVTKVGIAWHKTSTLTTSHGVLCSAIGTIDKFSFTGASTARPITPSIMYNYIDHNGMVGQAAFSGSGQFLNRVPLQIGDGSTATYLNAARASIELPSAYGVGQNDWAVSAGKYSYTIYASASCVMDFSSAIWATTSSQKFTIHPSSSLSATYNFATVFTGFDIAWLSGLAAVGASFLGCPIIDGKAGLFTGCTIRNSVSTTSAIKLTNGGSVAGSAFIKGAETYAAELQDAGTYDFTDTTFSGYTNQINVSAASSTVTIELELGQAVPTYVTAGATVVFAYPAISFVGPSYADDTRYQLSREQVFAIGSTAINTGTDEITLGNDSGGFAAALSIATSGFHSLVRLDLAAGATMPTSTPQIVNGGTYRVKTSAAGVITLAVAEGGTTINFTTAGTNNGGGVLFTVTTETDLAHGVVSGGLGLTVPLELPTNARVIRKAIHYKEVTSATVTSTFFVGTFIWNSLANTTDGADINNAVSPWDVPNLVGTISNVVLASPVVNSAGVAFTSLTPKNAGSLVTGLTLGLEGNGKIQINASDADGVVVGYDLAVWFPYTLSTEQGIWLCDDTTMTLTDLYNYSVTAMEVDETSGLFTQFVGINVANLRVSTASTGCVALNVATRGNGAVTSGGGGTAPTVSEIRIEMDTNSTKLANLDATISSRNAIAPATPANVTDARDAVIAALPIAAPTASANASAVRSELSVELARIDVATSSRNATTPPTAAANATAVRSELATELGWIDVAVSSRNAVAPDNASITAILADTNELQTNQGAWATATGFATPTNVTDARDLILTDIALVPTATENATAVRSELAPELAKVDALPADTSAILTTIDSTTKTTLAVSA